MKLKTKFQDEDFKLGEVADVNIATMPDGRIKAQAVAKSGGVHTFFYDDLKTFTNDWEDYEEPKEYWHIAELCGGLQRKQDTDNGEDRFNKQIGNYFETKEEAEKAIEKLKVFKRLKDKGFRFVGWCDSVSDNNPDMALFKLDEGAWETSTCDDLDLLFCTEENS